MLGDIHGDLDALRYCLRDCAKVIDENDNWIGQNTYVVVVGDLIDRARRRDREMNSVTNNEGKGVGEVENEEIKIQRLLNKLFLEARAAGGKIIKLLGNHEIMHLNQGTRGGANGAWVVKYSTNFGLINEEGVSAESGKNRLKNYVPRGQSRLKNYAPRGKSSGLLMACGGRMIVKIGKWIIVHGGILPKLINKILYDRTMVPKWEGKEEVERGRLFFEKANELLRKKYNNELTGDSDEVQKDIEMYDAYVRGEGKSSSNPLGDGRAGLVWDRHLSDLNSFKETNYSCLKNAEGENLRKEGDNICNPNSPVGLKEIFDLLGFPSDSKIVVAHTPQKDHGIFNAGIAWSLLPAQEQKNNGVTIFGPADQTGVVCCNYYNDGKNLNRECPIIPGITYQCPDDYGIGRIWRIDVGMSRGFDLVDEILYTEDREKIDAYWEGRKPQVLEVIHHFDGQDEVRVIRSNRHLPRPKSDFVDISSIRNPSPKQSWSDIDPNVLHQKKRI
jgi:hypothetical protein